MVFLSYFDALIRFELIHLVLGFSVRSTLKIIRHMRKPNNTFVLYILQIPDYLSLKEFKDKLFASHYGWFYWR